MSIKELQTQALTQMKAFNKQVPMDHPEDLTGYIWQIINNENNLVKIDDKTAEQYSQNWSDDLVGELQRTLVNYQLHQLKRGNPAPVFKMIEAALKNIEENGLSFLDIGCTSGYYFEVINHYYLGKFNYSGCDYNKSSIDLAKQYYPNVNFSVEDITKLSFSDRQFDVSFLSGVIEHVPNHTEGLNELCRITDKYIVLHRIFLTEEDTFCTKGTQYFVPVIRYTYNKNKFFKILSDNGFEIKWENEGFFDTNCKTYILERK
jgi:ubiquinone/menaquinone biosynthesis C-methylase UbiE